MVLNIKKRVDLITLMEVLITINIVSMTWKKQYVAFMLLMYQIIVVGVLEMMGKV
jgi:hypothetical protein